MKITRTESGALRISGVPIHLLPLIKQIPNAQELRSELAEDRLFPEPTQGSAEDGELNQDWKAFVEPELQQSFQTSRDVVESDLRRIEEFEDTITMEVPLAHLDAWLNALNQLRLAIVAAFRLSDEELNREEIIEIHNAHDLAVMRVHFYAYMQQLLLFELGYS